MKATFVAPDLVVLAQMLSTATSQEGLVASIKELLESDDYDEKVKTIVENPANLRYGWVRLDKDEENVDFLTALLLLSANNNYSVSNKDVIFTNGSAFVNINLLESFKNVAKSEDGIEINLEEKIDKVKILALAEDMFGEPQFMELYSTGDGPEMFMLSGTLCIDTWNMLSTIGMVSIRNFSNSDGDAKVQVPGMCILFGMAMTTLMHIVSNVDKIPEHISYDINRLPRARKTVEEEEKTKEIEDEKS